MEASHLDLSGGVAGRGTLMSRKERKSQSAVFPGTRTQSLAP